MNSTIQQSHESVGLSLADRSYLRRKQLPLRAQQAVHSTNQQFKRDPLNQQLEAKQKLCRTFRQDHYRDDTKPCLARQEMKHAPHPPSVRCTGKHFTGPPRSSRPFSATGHRFNGSGEEMTQTWVQKVPLQPSTSARRKRPVSARAVRNTCQSQVLGFCQEALFVAGRGYSYETFLNEDDAEETKILTNIEHVPFVENAEQPTGSSSTLNIAVKQTDSGVIDTGRRPSYFAPQSLIKTVLWKSTESEQSSTRLRDTGTKRALKTPRSVFSTVGYGPCPSSLCYANLSPQNSLFMNGNSLLLPSTATAQLQFRKLYSVSFRN